MNLSPRTETTGASVSESMNQQPQDSPPPKQSQTGVIRLSSYGQQSIVLPKDIRAFTRSRITQQPTLTTESVQKLFKRSIKEDILSLHRKAKEIEKKTKILLLLPDSTRSQDSSRILLDSLLELRLELSTLKPTIIFGLGTHPLMAEREIIAALEEHRYHKLIKKDIKIKQQTSLAPLPSKSLTAQVEASQLDTQSKAGTQSREITFHLPEDLWNNHLIYVAGNTELHPYETRCGSGGIHKMITVGLGAEATITTSHSAKILRQAGRIGNPHPNSFVRIIDSHANAIIKELLTSKDSLLQQPPRGFNVCLNEQKTILGCQTSKKDKARINLTQLLLAEHRVAITKPVNFVINDPEPQKMTDILAGARYLHMLCDSDGVENPIIDRQARARTALLFNACHTASNNNGIGNIGTIEHLLALKRFNIESESSDKNSRQKTLHRWSCYLNLRSEMQRVLRIVGRTAERISQRTGDSSCINDQLYSRLLKFVQYIKMHSNGTILKLMEEVEHWLLSGASAMAATLVKEALEQHRIPQGLGEGGQRALRLLKILERFDYLLIATDNKAVIHFIEELDPMQCAQTRKRNLGLVGIDLTIHSCQDAIDIALDHHRQACNQTMVQGLFLQAPHLITLAKES